jgi:hypothetical protein
MPGKSLLIAAAALWLAACAPMIPRVEAALEPAAHGVPENPIRLTQPVEVALSTGYTRRLAAGSQWRFAGKVPQGRVYRPVDGPFTIEGAQVHEAYLVIDRATLVGFYLPGERMMSPLSSPIQIRVEGEP